MTREEAIKRLEDTFEGWERWNPHNDSPASKLSEALDMAISALREQEERAKAEEEGRVVVLPCKVGDTVYEVKNNTDACRSCNHYSSWFGMDCLCDKQDFDSDYHEYPECAERPICEKQFMEVVEYQPKIETIFSNRHNFGKTIFLNREDAEIALRRLEEV